MTTSAERRGSLATIIEIAQVIVGLFGLLAVGGGVVAAVYTEENDDLFGATERPYLVAGIAAGVAGVAVAMFMFAVLAYMAWRIDEAGDADDAAREQAVPPGNAEQDTAL